MISIKRTHSGNKDFIALVKKLDIELAVLDGDEHSFYAQFNKIDAIKNAIIACVDNVPIACGAIKEYDEISMEIKRMYTLPEHRGKGIATEILHELEIWACELGYKKCVLETGIRQQDAIHLYLKNSYLPIPNFDQYENIASSRCFEKSILN